MRAEEPLRRNSPAWALDRFRSDALPRLIEDLAPVEIAGISEDECRRVKSVLNSIIDEASMLPDGGIFRRAIWQHLQEFHDLYAQWNDVTGSSKDAQNQRADVIRQIRDCRNKLAKAARTNAYILNRELDLKLVDSWYKSLRGLVESAPRIFLRLATAVARYFTRRGI